MNRAQRIQEKIKLSFKPFYFELENESHQHSVPENSETHFRLVLVSDLFVGKTRVERQRMVMDHLKEEFASGLHALTQRTMTTEEWAQVKDHFTMQSPPCQGGSKQHKGY